MSVRLEWTTAPLTYIKVYAPGQEADDGQTAEYEKTSHYTLVIGGTAIEGTRPELIEVVARALRALTLVPEQIPDDVANAWLDIYEHAIPDPEGEWGDEHGETVPPENMQRYEAALKTVHDYMSERRA